jgi:hypothetical protein
MPRMMGETNFNTGESTRRLMTVAEELEAEKLFAEVAAMEAARVAERTALVADIAVVTASNFTLNNNTHRAAFNRVMKRLAGTP